MGLAVIQIQVHILNDMSTHKHACAYVLGEVEDELFDAIGEVRIELVSRPHNAVMEGVRT